MGIDVPVLLDEDATVFGRWGGKILPTTYVLDGTGKVVDVVQGPLEWDRAEVIDNMRRILDGGTSPER
ncbi:TlpA family protein disulfide reductase [Thiocapsa bogorovii]|uniref:TlpA family protein disulfide reductase n=1 Tax=Thiocapsa bogorovii TaxID=521689 RepID=UPI001E626DD8|nr:hypothetical protein [Thiocapsa bogorovii]UHD16760.1 hypothetical protein LT988_01470 [Thiocapsa bogorovii]